MQSHFIRTCAAIGTIGLVGGAYAGDTTRFDVGWSDIDIFFVDLATEAPANAQYVDTADPGRYFNSIGWSNVDVNVCWNTGSSFSGWASEVVFDIEMNDATATQWFIASPFAGDDTGSDVEGECSNRQALAEFDLPLAAFTYTVDASGTVGTGMSATWDDGLGLRHSEVNTADFYFTLAGEAPSGCDGATGDCAEEHPEPGCSDIGCCSLVCNPDTGGDVFCCDSSWDSSCVNLAIALCNIFQYTCDAPAYANDCATDPIVVSNGGTYSTDTNAANYDGPLISCAAEGGPNVWYLIELTDATDQTLTASTCDAADYDTALTLWDMGEVGTPIAGSALEGAEVACNDDGAGCADFTSILTHTMTAGRQYLLSVSGYQGSVGTATLSVSWTDPTPQEPDPTCDNPGGTTVSQIITPDENLTISGGVWCGAGAANVLARSYPAAAIGGAFDVSCVNFGWFMNDIDAYMPCFINLYVQDAASPLDVTSQTLIGTTSCGLRGNGEYTLSSQSFDTPVNVDLADGEFLMVEVAFQRQLQEGGADGYGGYFGVVLADTDGAEGYISCGGDYFGSLTDIGFGDYQPYITFNGDGGDPPSTCEGDFNDDGVVNGADFGSILAAWGPCAGCPEDLNGDGEVGGADVGLLLSVWGPCDP